MGTDDDDDDDCQRGQRSFRSCCIDHACSVGLACWCMDGDGKSPVSGVATYGLIVKLVSVCPSVYLHSIFF